MRYLYLLLLVFMLILPQCAPSQPAYSTPATLNQPFSAPKTADRQYLHIVKCEAPTKYVPYSLQLPGRYRQDDPHRATVDPRLAAEYKVQAVKLMRYENKVIRMSNSYLASGKQNITYAQCALLWLSRWAKRDALLGPSNKTGEVVRQWTLSSLALSYGQIKDEPSLDTRQKQLVEKWLREIAALVIKNYPFQTDIKRKKNNHLYWASWAVTATGMALNDRKLFHWGMNRARYIVMNDIQADGTLPLEMKRGSKALHYHQFSVIPLVMLAEAGLHNGINVYAIKDGLLHHLVKRVLVGLDDPSYFDEATGIKQESTNTLNGGHLAWMEVYNARFQHPLAQKWINKYRPMKLRRIGGDTTLLYSHKEE